MGDSAERKTVVVTGFGPFGCHSVNASWVAVQELEKMGLSHDVDLVTYELPVKYAMVRECIPSLWKKCQPTLVVHVGVSGIAKEITLEQQAHNEGYDKVDVEGSLPACNECMAGGAGTIVSDIVMGHVSNAVNCSECKATAVVSRDPGRYLCDFTYYSSLSIDEHRSAFIHVPPLDKPYSAQELAEGLKVAINAMLKQIT